jgi:hypothetical protein
MITLLCLDPLHVSGVKRPFSGGTTLAVFGELHALVAVGWLQVLARLVPQLATSQQLQVHTTHTKNCCVAPPENGHLTPETCRESRHNKVIVKVY